MQLQDHYINQLHQRGIIKDRTEEAAIRYGLISVQYELIKLFLLAVLFYVFGYLGVFLCTFL
ncbi:MAG: accessory gene regulator B family protein, partial [Eubacteriales bacterium]|nr:accessory gene regulator B family protein [Eubacteriales bacterium]